MTMKRALLVGATVGALSLASRRGRRTSAGGELHVYDFDGTLFRSPSSPAVWSRDWWADTASTLPPCVPAWPDDKWWISPTVHSARKSIADANVFTIMLTGRKDMTGLRYRLPELLWQKKLNFDAVHLDPGGNALTNKIHRVQSYLRRYPFITRVQLWDDRPSHLTAFQTALSPWGVTVVPHHVRALSRPAGCEARGVSTVPVRKPLRYAAVVLDSKSRAALAYAYPFAHDKIQNDHVTLVYKPKLTEHPWLAQWLGKPVRMRVKGYAEDDLGQAVEVEFIDPVPYRADAIPHVSLSHDRSVTPAYSKQLLAQSSRSRRTGKRHHVISGIVDTQPSSLRRDEA